jgi:hypothetical protein
MDLDTRREFLHRGSQIGVAAVLGGVAGCMGSRGSSDGSNSTNPKYIENISFSSSKMMIDPTKKAVGKTYQLKTPSGNESVWSETVSGDQTKVQMTTWTLVEDPKYPSGNYTLQVVDSTEVISERVIKLAPDVKVLNVGKFDSGGDSSFGVELSNHGTLIARVKFEIVSGVPNPTDDVDESGIRAHHIDENKTRYMNGIGVNETAKFDVDYTSELFKMESKEEVYNYTAGNSSFSSRHCTGTKRKATLLIDVINGGKNRTSFNYALTGNVSDGDVGKPDPPYYCEYSSVLSPDNQTKSDSKMKSQMSNTS